MGNVKRRSPTGGVMRSTITVHDESCPLFALLQARTVLADRVVSVVLTELHASAITSFLEGQGGTSDVARHLGDGAVRRADRGILRFAGEPSRVENRHQVPEVTLQVTSLELTDVSTTTGRLGEHLAVGEGVHGRLALIGAAQMQHLGVLQVVSKIIFAVHHDHVDRAHRYDVVAERSSSAPNHDPSHEALQIVPVEEQHLSAFEGHAATTDSLGLDELAENGEGRSIIGEHDELGAGTGRANRHRESPHAFQQEYEDGSMTREIRSTR